MGADGPVRGAAERRRAVSDLELTIGGERVELADGWSVSWLPDDPRIARLIAPDGSHQTAVVEGSGAEWAVTIRGRRIPVLARSWRERVLAEAESAAAASGGPVAVTATLPGLVVAVAVSVGDDVGAGTALLTIEAMKMQNEVRAPRDGRVAEVAVSAGQAVATGALLLRLE
jgi:biotin carboxyl carrier protein